MQDLVTPLSDEEFDRLDHFLLERIDEEADSIGKDEGVLDISELDGLFTAIVSGPESRNGCRRCGAISSRYGRMKRSLSISCR